MFVLFKRDVRVLTSMSVYGAFFLSKFNLLVVLQTTFVFQIQHSFYLTLIVVFQVEHSFYLTLIVVFQVEHSFYLTLIVVF